MQNPNIFYYSEDHKKITMNRVEAMADPLPYRFYYYDKEYDKADWTKEPPYPLSQYYRERAEWIKSNYDYVILAYSGGADSTNILETFYYNDIPLNEILMVGAFSQDSRSGVDENHNGEIYHNALPLLNKLNIPNTKVTMLDYTKYFSNLDNFNMLKEHGSMWAKEMNSSYYSVHNVFWRDIDKFLNINNDKKTAIIFGSDKPNFIYDSKNNKYITHFRDDMITAYGNISSTENFHKVDFYTHPDCINMTIKQLHVIKKSFQENILSGNIESSLWDLPFIDNIIYSLKNPLSFRSPKSSTRIFSLRDQYLLKHTNSDIYKIYREGLKNIMYTTDLQKNITIAFRTKIYYF